RARGGCPASWPPLGRSGRSPLAATEHAPRAGKLQPELRQRHIADAFTRLRGRDRGPLRNHELDVAAALGEEQVARAKAREADRPAHAQLIPARAGELP